MTDPSTGRLPELDPDRFATHTFDGRGFDLAYVREGVGGVPLLLVHGYPETKRIWWRVIEPLAAAGFEVIVPDLRGFGESAIGPDGFHDAPASSKDLHALVHDHLGHDEVTLVAGDFGGAIIQDFALRFPEATARMVLFNSPLPILAEEMQGLRTMSTSAHDYFLWQGTEADALIAELSSETQRRRYISTFYTSRFWAHPGAFDDAAVAFHTEPFADAAKLRASWGCYESVFDRAKRSDQTLMRINPDVRALILFGPSDHVIMPDFDRAAAIVLPDHIGPFTIPACGHFLQWEAAETLINAIAGFCADLRPAS